MTDGVMTLEDAQAEHVRNVLEFYRGNATRAARALGIDRRTLYRKCARWGVSLLEYRWKNSAAEAAGEKEER